MSTRSATNKRSTTGEVTGMARKSASSAKPARAAAGSVRVVPASSKARRKQAERGEDLSNLSKEERKARKRAIRAEEDRAYVASNYLLKSDPAYDKLRKIWWGLIIAGCAIIAVAWIWVYTNTSSGTATGAQLVLIIAAYVAIIGAFVFDFIKIRPLRNGYRDQVEGMTDKQIRSLCEQQAAADDAKRAAKEAKKAAKNSK